MDEIINYLDLPEEEKDSVWPQLKMIGLSGKSLPTKRQRKHIQAGTLPQYLFVFRDTALIGYQFLFGEHGSLWAIDNSDELPLPTALRLLEHGSRLSAQCGCSLLAQRLREHMEAQK